MFLSNCKGMRILCYTNNSTWNSTSVIRESFCNVYLIPSPLSRVILNDTHLRIMLLFCFFFLHTCRKLTELLQLFMRFDCQRTHLTKIASKNTTSNTGYLYNNKVTSGTNYFSKTKEYLIFTLTSELHIVSGHK